MDFPGGSVINNPSVNTKMHVQFLVWEDALGKEMTIHFSVFLPGKPHGQRRLASYIQSMRLQSQTQLSD